MTTLNESKALAEQIISRAIQEVVFKYNAYAPIISSFRIAYTTAIPTIGVDRYARLVANPDFIVENEAHMRGLIIHEVLHVFFGHTTDKRTRLAYSDTDLQHNRIANIAEDCAINQFIEESLPDGAITPVSLAKMLSVNSVPYNETAEFYYDLIMEHNNSLSSQSTCSTGDANTQQVQDLLDKMGVPHISEEEVNDKVVDMATQISKYPGHQYGDLAAFAKKLLTPKVDWRPLLSATLRNAEKKVYTIHTHKTYKRTSRRSTQAVFFPKSYGHKISVALSFDTSGSITTDMVNQFLSEVQSCMRYSNIKECALWHTSVYWYGTPAQLSTDIEKIFQSGGTEESAMGAVEQHIKADLYIHFSDGYHGDNYGFKHPSKNIEIIWDNKEIKEIRRF